MNRLSTKSRVNILRALVEGCSIRSIERLTGHHRDTITRVMLDASKKSKMLMDTYIKEIPEKNIQADELWTFVQKKDRYLTPSDNGNIGSKFIFVSIDKETKLVLNFAVGKRDLRTAIVFMKELRKRVEGRPHLTTDRLRAYEDAVERAFGPNVDYAQLIKVYRRPGNPRREGYSPVDLVLSTLKVVCGYSSKYLYITY